MKVLFIVTGKNLALDPVEMPESPRVGDFINLRHLFEREESVSEYNRKFINDHSFTVVFRSWDKNEGDEVFLVLDLKPTLLT